MNDNRGHWSFSTSKGPIDIKVPWDLPPFDCEFFLEFLEIVKRPFKRIIDNEAASRLVNVDGDGI